MISLSLLNNIFYFENVSKFRADSGCFKEIVNNDVFKRLTRFGKKCMHDTIIIFKFQGKLVWIYNMLKFRGSAYFFKS